MKRKAGADAKPKMVKHEIQNAYVLTAETGDMIRQALAEIPHKYRQIGPILQVLEVSVRGNVIAELPEGIEVPKLSVMKPPPPGPEELKESKELESKELESKEK